MIVDDGEYNSCFVERYPFPDRQCSLVLNVYP
jgi:hypothetical protein